MLKTGQKSKKRGQMYVKMTKISFFGKHGFLEKSCGLKNIKKSGQKTKKKIEKYLFITYHNFRAICFIDFTFRPIVQCNKRSQWA